MDNFRLLKIMFSFLAILISVSIVSIPVHAETYAEAWLRKQKEADEKLMDELEADGNLTQEAIDSISKGTSKRKPNKAKAKTESTKSNSNSNVNSNYSEGKGWIYSTDELHVVGLPEDSETGYTKSGWYGDVSE